jgi:hypothetical protein
VAERTRVERLGADSRGRSLGALRRFGSERGVAAWRGSAARHTGSATLTVLYAGQCRGARVGDGPTRMCELLFGLPEVRLLGVVDVVGEPMMIVIEQRAPRPHRSSCSGAAT